MADGMFNYTDPRLLQQAYQQQFSLTPQQMASLPLLNQVAAIGGNAGASLGTNLGRLFGGQTALEAENEVLKDIFTKASQASTDPIERMTIAAQALRDKGLEGRAQQLEEQIQKAQLSQAQISTEQAKAREADAKAGAAQLGIQGRAQFIMSRIEGLTPEMAMGLAEKPDVAAKLLENPKVPTQVVETADGQLLINKETGAVIANLGRSPERGTRVTTNVSPIIKQGADVIGLTRDYENLTRPDRELLKTAESAKTLVSEAIASNNTVSWEAARTTLARAAGEGKLSNEDIRRTGVDPRLVQGALDWVNKKVEGVPNQDIMRQLATVAAILERQAVDRINATSERVRATARVSGISEAEYDTLFPMMNSSTATRPTTSGSTGVVDFNDLR